DPSQRRPLERGDRRPRTVAAEESKTCNRPRTAPSMERALMNRRTFLTTSAAAAAGVGVTRVYGGPASADAQRQDATAITVDPTPLFELSPYLFMQFMEPLGATDGSVEAAWDHQRDEWREDVVAI